MSMTDNNGHAQKRFAGTRSRTFMCVQWGFRGAAPDKQMGVFVQRKFPEYAKEGPLCPACHDFYPVFLATNNQSKIRLRQKQSRQT